MANQFLNIVKTLPSKSNFLRNSGVFHSTQNLVRPIPTRTLGCVTKIEQQSQITSIVAGVFTTYHQYQPLRRISSTPINNNEATKEKLIELMPISVDQILSGRSIYNAFTGWLTIWLGIKRLDPEFSTKEFLRGAAQAIEVVSKRLAEQRYDELEGLVAADALTVIKKNVERMTDDQRRELALRRENITKIYWQKINLSQEKNKTTVEIMVKVHMFANKPNDPQDFKKFL